MPVPLQSVSGTPVGQRAPETDDRWMRYPPQNLDDWSTFCRRCTELFPQMAMPGPRVYELWPEPIYPWGWNESKGKPPVWFHDIFNADGTFLYPEEEAIIRSAVAGPLA